VNSIGRSFVDQVSRGMKIGIYVKVVSVSVFTFYCYYIRDFFGIIMREHSTAWRLKPTFWLFLSIG